MKKKISVFRALTLVIVTCVLTAAVTTAVTLGAVNTVISDISSRKAIYDALFQADALIRSDYLGEIDSKKLSTELKKGYLNSLDVGTNYLMSEKELRDYESRQSGRDPVTGETFDSIKTEKFASSLYIKINYLSDRTPEEVKNAIEKTAKEKSGSLIIDVRGLESMNFASAAKVTDMLTPMATEGTGAIATVKDKNGKIIKTFSADRDSVAVPVGVLIDKKTAGAPELIAADIKDFGKGAVVGEKSKGCGTFQKLYKLSSGGAVILTVGRVQPYISPSFDGAGVMPDYETPETKAVKTLDSDTTFLKAYAVLSSLR